MTKRPDQHNEISSTPAQEPQGVNPRTWTPAQRNRSRRKSAFLKALHEHGSIQAACLATGIHDSTVWRWRKQYPAFDLAVTNFTEGVREQRIVESLYRIATSEDPKMANASAKAGEFLLKVWNRDKYTDVQRIEQTQTINHMVQVVYSVRDGIRERQQQALQRLKESRTLDAPTE